MSCSAGPNSSPRTQFPHLRNGRADAFHSTRGSGPWVISREPASRLASCQLSSPPWRSIWEEALLSTWRLHN